MRKTESSEEKLLILYVGLVYTFLTSTTGHPPIVFSSLLAACNSSALIRAAINSYLVKHLSFIIYLSDLYHIKQYGITTIMTIIYLEYLSEKFTDEYKKIPNPYLQ